MFGWTSSDRLAACYTLKTSLASLYTGLYLCYSWCHSYGLWTQTVIHENRKRNWTWTSAYMHECIHSIRIHIEDSMVWWWYQLKNTHSVLNPVFDRHPNRNWIWSMIASSYRNVFIKTFITRGVCCKQTNVLMTHEQHICRCSIFQEMTFTKHNLQRGQGWHVAS